MTLQNPSYPLDHAAPPVDAVRAPLGRDTCTTDSQFERELATLFRGSWLFAGPAALYATPNSSAPVEIAGLRLVITSDEHGQEGADYWTLRKATSP